MSAVAAPAASAAPVAASMVEDEETKIARKRNRRILDAMTEHFLDCIVAAQDDFKHWKPRDETEVQAKKAKVDERFDWYIGKEWRSRGMHAGPLTDMYEQLDDLMLLQCTDEPELAEYERRMNAADVNYVGSWYTQDWYPLSFSNPDVLCDHVASSSALLYQKGKGLFCS